MKKLNKGQFTKACVFLLAGMFVMVCGCAKESETVSLFELVAEETAFELESGEGYPKGAEKTVRQEDSVITVSGTVVVHICGEVVSPGVYEISSGSRIYDVVMQAGGFTAEASEDYLNLATPVKDGMQIRILTQTEAEEERKRQATQDAGLININTASLAELCTLPGIGESRAQDIIAYRENNGNFVTKEAIMQVSGIKDAMYDKIKDKICVE